MASKALLGFVGVAFGAGAFGYSRQQQRGGLTSSSAGRARSQAELLGGDVSLMNIEQRFRHFASIGDGKLMTPEDFYASFIGGGGEAPSEGPVQLSPAAKKLFDLFDDNKDGTLSYPEYCMLFTLLANGERNFRIAFKMFDRDSNGSVDAGEFKTMVTALSCDPSVRLSFEGAVMKHFFGEKLDRTLPFSTFERMMRDLRAEVRAAEFAAADKLGHGRITLGDLRRLVFRHDADKRAAQPGDDEITIPRVAYQKLGQVLLQEDVITRAMNIFTAANAEAAEKGLNKVQFARALSCSGVPLSAQEVDAIFRLFDTNGSGTIDADEFEAIAKLRTTFFASHVPSFSEPERSVVQQFAHCMQQRD